MHIIVFTAAIFGFIFSLYTNYNSKVRLPLPYLMLIIIFTEGNFIDFGDLLSTVHCSSVDGGITDTTYLNEVKRPMSVPERAQLMADAAGVVIGVGAGNAQLSGNKRVALTLTVASAVTIFGAQVIGKVYNTFPSAVVGDGTRPSKDL